MDIQLDPLPIVERPTQSIIKVIGVGGGGGNAVNQMYRQGICDVSFLVINTDVQDLKKSPVPMKMSIGPTTTKGLGAGAEPNEGRKAAEESEEDIRKALSDGTEMVFITAGMGGGTGTGAAPVVARIARELDILTIGIVTIPFSFEQNEKIQQAFEGIAALNEHVDAILVINNEKLYEEDMPFSEAFRLADNVLANAAKSIAEIITITGYINIDFADVKRILKDGNVAMMNTGAAEGENRVLKAIENALNSSLLDYDVYSAKKILLNIYCAGEGDENQIRTKEVREIKEFMAQMSSQHPLKVIWGITFDNSLGKTVKVTLVATGFDITNVPGMSKKMLGEDKTREEIEGAMKQNYRTEETIEDFDDVEFLDNDEETEKNPLNTKRRIPARFRQKN